MDGVGPMRLDTADAADPRQAVTVFHGNIMTHACMHIMHTKVAGTYKRVRVNMYAYVYIYIYISTDLRGDSKNHQIASRPKAATHPVVFCDRLLECSKHWYTPWILTVHNHER